ncbi:putative salicylate synthetase [Gordonia effusa NBRC 100432]|uniref:Putative salicylate synthetase n=1 Tax=Gordonia effusa NBRC 100432 TaxID=1077974 RepID=H0QXR5_9ACTN|nr:salicylate synthase [Gordonia effusa]GAB17616.1 putative salicylate synthetase [Gordonia effusa NBRC 100432]
MSLTTDQQNVDHSLSAITPEQAARICAAWADEGSFGDHVVYERDGRWVFAAGARVRIVLTKDTITVTRDADQTSRGWAGDPSIALDAALRALDLPQWRVYGWVGFDFCASHHDLTDRVLDDAVLAHLIVPEFEAYVDATGIDTSSVDPVRAERLHEIASNTGQLAESAPIDVTADVDDYRGRVATAVAEIRRGDYQKVIMSRRVSIPFSVDMPATYARGRAGNNPARSFLLSLGSLEAAGFSPELVVAVDERGTVVTEPLAGTRAFGRSAQQDSSARAELVSDSKEIAEHAISVRACFDEIESIAVADSTAVSEFMVVRERGSVQHLASTVRGSLDPAAGPWRALAVLFPSITASGIPKREAIEAIYRLEPHGRELYSGAVLTASSAGDLEATLALRTAFSDDGQAWLCAGAGVVDQSTPDREFEETCEKLGSVAPFVVPAAD